MTQSPLDSWAATAARFILDRPVLIVVVVLAVFVVLALIAHVLVAVSTPDAEGDRPAHPWRSAR